MVSTRSSAKATKSSPAPRTPAAAAAPTSRADLLCTPEPKKAPTTPTATTTPRGKYNSSTFKERGQHGLASHLKKQLVLDIEAAGGISTFNDARQTQAINRLLDCRVDLFPDKESREKAQSFIRSLRKLHKDGQYAERVLLPLHVAAAVIRPKSSYPSSSSSSSLSSSSSRTSAGADKVKAKNKKDGTREATPTTDEDDEEILLLSKTFSRTQIMSRQDGGPYKGKNKLVLIGIPLLFSINRLTGATALLPPQKVSRSTLIIRTTMDS